jgi:DNA-binding NarL/FixJ family response regulator
MTRITVAIIDDHAIIREGVETYLNGSHLDVKIVGSASVVAELPAGVVPNVVILDLVLRDRTSLEDVPVLVERGSRVLLYTSEERPVPLRRAVELGVSGVLLKGDPIATLVEGITMAMEGQFYVSGPLAHALITDPALVSDLSEQQRQVLQCIDEGLDYRATARIMNISGNTVKEYLARIRDKYRDRGLHPGNSHHLTRLAFEEGHLG